MPRPKAPRRVTNDQLKALAARVGTLLKARGWKISTAESCTGGWIAKVCTDAAGSSNWFASGVVTYSNASKTDLLGVSTRILMKFGAVSEQTAVAMASGALRNLKSDVAVAVTGVAGPGGGSAEKPVGTVWVAWASRVHGRTSVAARIHHFDGGRNVIRMQAVSAALQGILDL